jgi:hypothetical protein
MTELFPRQLQLAVKQGFARLRGARKSRAMYVRQYAGQYYIEAQGLTGEEPLNLIYQTVKATVPVLVSSDPVTRVTSPLVAMQDYAWLLGKGLDEINRIVGMKELLRRGIVDALFMMGIFKTGISASDSVLTYGDTMIDNGQIFTETVSLDDFVFDTDCKLLRKSSFIGDAVRVPRQILLDDSRYDHDAVLELPRSGHADVSNKLEQLSRKVAHSELAELEDFVDVVPLWIPGAQQLVTIADPRVVSMDKFLAQSDYYGPKEGPYQFLTLSQPVPDNPMPISPIGVWFDLHMLANRTMKKAMYRVDARKSILAYDPGQVDEVQAMKDGADGDFVACNPESVKAIAVGGEGVEESLAALQQIQYWGNYMAGNPDAASGAKPNTDVATVANIMQSNAAVGLNDSLDKVYECTRDIKAAQAWHMHHDPLINTPVSHRLSNGESIQLYLTPEQRAGDWDHLVFEIKRKSMSAPDPKVQAKQVLDFAANVLPSVAQTAMVLQQQGVQFNPTACLKTTSELMGIDEDITGWFFDPQHEQRLMLLAQLGPKTSGKATSGQAKSLAPGGDKINVATPQQDMNASFQDGANQGQSINQGVY